MFRYICNIGILAYFSFLVFVRCLLFKMALVFFFFSLPMTKKGNKGGRSPLGGGYIPERVLWGFWDVLAL